jgi:hypothetical protein
VSDTVEAFRSAYAASFGEYLDAQREEALHAAYELGRDAVESELSVLDLAAIHHEVLRRALARASGPDEVETVTRAAEQFFLESLSAFEIVRRSYHEARAAAESERRNTAVLQQLSSFLADASLAVDSRDSLAEMLQLLAEQAREILDADSCTVALVDGGEASFHGEAAGEPVRLTAALTGLDGRTLGAVEVARAEREFSTLDEAILVHLAQMASAAIERVRLYAA